MAARDPGLLGIDTEPERAAVDASFRANAALRGAVTENLKPLRAGTDALAVRVDSAFAAFDLNPVPPQENARPARGRRSRDDSDRRTYVEHGTDVAETLDRVILDGVDALESSQTRRAITFRDRSTLEGLSTDGSSTVELEKLIEHIGEKSGGSSLLRTRASAECRAEVRANEIVAEIKAGQDAEAADADGKKPAAAREADELVKGSVNVQMNSATSPEESLAYGSMPKIPNTADKDETQKSVLDTFELRAGASDVTSYHDFHTLQIAFPHVWTRIFDGELETLGRKLYREYVKLKDFGGYPEVDDLKISTVKDLRRLIDEVRKLSQWVEDDIPLDLRDPTDDGGGSKGTGEFEKDLQTVIDVATLGGTWLLRQVVEEFSKIGRKPIIKWDEFPGPWSGRLDKIDRARVEGVAPDDNVEIALTTAGNSRVKIIELQILDQGTKQLVPASRLDNRYGRVVGDTLNVSMVVPSAWMATSVLVFSSEESSQADIRDRYVLAELGGYIVERSRVTFTWRDS